MPSVLQGHRAMDKHVWDSVIVDCFAVVAECVKFLDCDSCAKCYLLLKSCFAIFANVQFSLRYGE